MIRSLALPMEASSWSSLWSSLARRSRMGRLVAAEEAHGDVVEAREPADGACQVGLAASDVAVEDEVLGVVDELEDFELGAVPVGRRFQPAPVVVVEVFGCGEAGLAQEALRERARCSSSRPNHVSTGSRLAPVAAAMISRSTLLVRGRLVAMSMMRSCWARVVARPRLPLAVGVVFIVWCPFIVIVHRLSSPRNRS